ESDRRGAFLELCTAFRAVAEAVAYAHAQEVIHRDLKPENVILGAFGDVVVIDWGLGRVLPSQALNGVGMPDALGRGAPPRPSGPTGDDEWTIGAGTRGYMSPEQA